MHIQTRTARWPFFIGALLLAATAIAAASRIPDREHLDIWLGLAGGNDVSKRTVLSRLTERIISGKITADVPEISIDIKFEDYLTIKEDRDRGLRTGVLTHAREVPGWVDTPDGARLPIRIRLKGDLYPHWSDANRWSFRVEFKRGTSLNGFSVMSLQQAGNRQFPEDQLFQFWLRQVGVVTPRFQFFRVSVNGEDWGVMLAEEHMGHQLLERNERKEGAIIKFGNELNWYYEAANRDLPTRPPARLGTGAVSLYGEGKYRDDPRIRQQYARAAAIGDAAAHGQRGTAEMLDRETFAKALAAALAWNNTHTLHYPNSRFYLNPFTLRLEPVPTDQAYVSARQPLSTTAGGVPQIYRAFAGDLAFAEAYSVALAELSEKLPSLAREHRRLCAFVPLDCPDFDIGLLEMNLEGLKAEGRETLQTKIGTAPPQEIERGTTRTDAIPVPEAVDYPIHLRARYFEGGTLRLTNPLQHGVTVQEIRLICDGPPSCEPRTILSEPFEVPAGRTGAYPLSVDVELGLGKLWRSQRLLVTSNVGGETRVATASITEMRDTGSPLHTVTDIPDFFHSSARGYSVPRGTWTVSNPIVLPKGAALEIAAGTTLLFDPNAYIVVKGPLLAVGSEPAPIRFQPNGTGYWKGIYVMETNARSRLEHVEISRAAFTKDGALDLTGAITFYKADVDILHVRSIGTRAEDAFNIVHSDFTMKDVYIADTGSDAIDSDFSTGRLEAIVFRDIDGDGLDTSGSEIVATNLDFLGIDDKALSIGEHSRAVVSNVVARDVEVGAASKDLSTLVLRNMKIRGTRFHAAMAYIKKSYFGPATLEIKGLDADAGVIAQTGSTLTVDGVAAPTVSLDVRALYRAGPMRKN